MQDMAVLVLEIVRGVRAGLRWPVADGVVDVSKDLEVVELLDEALGLDQIVANDLLR